MPRFARLGAVLVSLAMALAVAGCGSDDSGDSGSGDTVVAKKDSSGRPTVDVAFTGNSVDPLGAKVAVKVGEPLKLRITADQPGEIHVHSSPGQKLAYDAGTSEKTLTIDKPGVVDVESHDLDKLIMQLEVR